MKIEHVRFAIIDPELSRSREIQRDQRFEMMTRFKNHQKKRGKVRAGHGHISKHMKHPGSRGNAGGIHHY
ncbi:hypothetical protein L1049_006827 [Liquidambar formosana]|uniref:Uncharacterized protein n=1 Tax=Liquidambar formosana TaxID=63359 RepID=A0AAP0RG94_LIQFO